jgi:hypothetical protein
MTKIQFWVAVSFAALMAPLIRADPPPPPKWAGDAITVAPAMTSESIRWLCYSLPGQLVWLIGTEISVGRLTDLVVAESVRLG